MVKIGRHIVAHGTVSSSKTTFARRIADSIGVPCIEPDAPFYLLTNWRGYHQRKWRVLKETSHQASIIQLHSSQEVDAFLGGLYPTTE